MSYRPKGMPARFMEGAPESVRAGVLDIFAVTPAAPLDFDIVLSAPVTDVQTGELYGFNGVDFSASGARGCHFFLNPRQTRAYRESNRRKRVAWSDLPEPTQKAVLAYLESY